VLFGADTYVIGAVLHLLDLKAGDKAAFAEVYAGAFGGTLIA